MRSLAEVFDRINVLNNPVNFVDPLGLFVFGKRPLGNSTEGFYGGEGGPIGDYFNLEMLHEHGFFEDGSGENVGFRSDGRFKEEHWLSERYTFDSVSVH